MSPSNLLPFFFFLKNFGYIFLVRLSWLKNIKNYYKSPLKVCELKAWVKLLPGVFKNVKTVQQKKPIHQSHRKFIFPSTFCIGLSGLPFADNISCIMLWVSPCVISILAAVQLYNVLALRFLDMKYFSFANVSIPV